jgi:hypothetical protein
VLTVCIAALSVAHPSGAAVTPEEARALGRDAYYYAYPIVLTDITSRQVTNVPNATAVPMRAPLNRFAHFRSYPRGDARDIVRFNFDTLYSFAWLDLTKGPIVLSVPDTGGRYYLVPMLDMWTDVFAVVGTRTTGGRARQFAIAAPGWKGKLPKGVELIQAPTPRVWVMGRTQTNGPADYDSVHAIPDAYTLTPLSQWGRRPTAPKDVPVARVSIRERRHSCRSTSSPAWRCSAGSPRCRRRILRTRTITRSSCAWRRSGSSPAGTSTARIWIPLSRRRSTKGPKRRWPTCRPR